MTAASTVQLAALAVWVFAVVFVVVREVRAYRRERSTAAAREHLADEPRRRLLELDDVVWDWPVLLRPAAGMGVPAAVHVNSIEGRASTCLVPPES
jgi:flagellar biosynthesis/type III secretory pathway M-ring protein FliF/YscJ